MLRPGRLVALAGLVVLALFYWRPLHAYMRTKHELARREGQVANLRRQQEQLRTRISEIDSGKTLVPEARQLGLVKPGERLFIVRGISAWRRAHSAAASH